MTYARVGVDTGGTFTDLVYVEATTGRRAVHKLPTTKEDPARGILEGVAALLQKAGARPANVQVVHGTTLATNALLEGTYAPAGMLTTAGFRDVLEIGRQRRPSFFNLDVPKPTPPARRDRIFEIPERIAADGSVVVPVDANAVRQAVEALRAKDVRAIAICFLHAYANPEHEAAAEAIVRSAWPEVYVCRSSAVLKEFREFERFATTCINAALMPVVDRYLERFEAGLAALGIAARPLVMQSNGGTASCAAIRQAPVNTFVSGPAGGVIAAVRLCRHLDVQDAVTFDMGGTSTDVSLVRGGIPGLRTEREIGGFPVRVPLLDIHTVGAGGGSVAWLDPGGHMKVGPRSAGAEPGPALYGRGGTEATVTDANVVLGRLAGTALLDGGMATYPERSHAAVEAVGRALNLDPVDAAAGIVAIVNANMIGAVRVVSVERGEDPRRCALVAFGGAGALHAAEVADGIGIARVIVPRYPGLLSAEGLVGADTRGDFSVTCLSPLAAAALPTLRDGLNALEKAAADWTRQERLDQHMIRREWAADLRYAGQSFQIRLPLDNAALDESALADLSARFHRRHELLNGYAMPDHPIEAVNLYAAVVLPGPGLATEEPAAAAEAPAAGKRGVWFPETGFVDTPVYRRDGLAPAACLAGPAIVEQMDATTLLPPGWRGRIDEATGALVLEREDR